MTTLDQLEPRGQIEQTDLMLLRDENNNDYKAQISDLVTDEIAEGNTKAATSNAVNNALANYEKKTDLENDYDNKTQVDNKISNALADKIKIETTQNAAISIGAGQNNTYNATKPTDTNYQWYLLTIYHISSAYVEECFHSLDGYVVLRNNFTSQLSVTPINQWLGIKK